MKRLVFIMSLLLSSTITFAIPAKRGQWKTITLNDGSQVRVELVGDEFMHFWKAEDGRKFIRVSDDDFRSADIKQMQAEAMINRAQRHQKAKTRAIADSKVYSGKPTIIK